ncbi:hypothetical protein [Kluyvera genomosp. 3]|uniref:Uncharacterized protein n=1 Tax=Kluyvera genomosp. 3 TaxID=2774055 RepID=A0A6G9RN51_9ENTR|nr:hypothetical protein [Kluyvera genomosp. 3]QIR27723.1 hypothetical protein GY169_13325 [Kluyvera genomosp. 3]
MVAKKKNSHGSYIDEWPVIHSGEWFTQNGNIFKWREDHWQKVEAYLASVPTQYGCSTYEEQFERLQRILGDRLHPLRWHTNTKPWFLVNGELVDECPSEAL